MARTDAIVLGAGIVGVSVALHLAKRGLAVALLDRGDPGQGTSYGNAGIIEGNTLFPAKFPAGLGALLRIALKRAPEANYHLSFLPKVGAAIASIPVHVMGGICILLFGIIASAGVRMMVEDKTDFSQKRNLIIASVILVIGIGGAKIHIGATEIGEMSLATYVGVILNLILPHAKDEKAGH